MTSDLSILQVKYAGNLPRYTSYPTAVEFKEIGPDLMVPDLYRNTLRQGRRISLYIHLPFCRSLCYFCACNKVITSDESLKERYLEALDQEAQRLLPLLPPESAVVQIHLGGGSPSYLDCAQLERLDRTVQRFKLASMCERSVEVDPRTFTSQQFETWYNQGYRRFSLGVQDFDREVQELINRVQDEKLVSDAVERIRSKSGTSINFDLIYGLPGQTREGFARTIAEVLRLRPERLAVYGYAHVRWKVKVQKVFDRHPLPTTAERLELISDAVSTLQAAGYRYIGIDHFALPEDELSRALDRGALRRNFMGYTTVTGDHLLALGVSAISDLGSYLIQNAAQLDQYFELLRTGKLPAHRIISRTEEDQIRALAIESLMCNRKLALAELSRAYPDTKNVAAIFAAGQQMLIPMQNDGLVELSPDLIRITPTGCYFLRSIAAVFDQYLQSQPPSGQRFSASV
ncbi:MAG: oxygen-independent coproporphyrinogen III oxidase [Oligoflexia bacterium]|nr:oxygen-independent coproporphyrinogen III oxidase [Oligoflexia bacterium]